MLDTNVTKFLPINFIGISPNSVGTVCWLEHQYGDIMEAVQYCSAAKYRMYGHYGQNSL